jgi:hypothetical protein
MGKLMTSLRKYQLHRNRAKYAGIGFNLSFHEWMNIWEHSGKFNLRGIGKGKYCMSRIGDTGPYEIGNVYINLNENNAYDGTKGRISPTKGIPHTAEAKAKISAGQTKRHMNRKAGV